MENRIALIRAEKGLSLSEVARRTNTTASQIQKLEKGDRKLTPDWMQRIAPALGVKVHELFEPNIFGRPGNPKIMDYAFKLARQVIIDSGKKANLEDEARLFTTIYELVEEEFEAAGKMSVSLVVAKRIWNHQIQRKPKHLDSD